MPIRTPRLLIRPKQRGDGALTVSAIEESWEELHQWMRWAEEPTAFTAEALELRNLQSKASFLRREIVELIGTDPPTGRLLVWCGLHDIDWQARQCDTGFWVRHSAQRHGLATEAANAMLRYAFEALGMRRVGFTHSAGNAASQRIAQKLGFALEGVQKSANLLPGGRLADRFCYARLDLTALPPLNVTWGTHPEVPHVSAHGFALEG